MKRKAGSVIQIVNGWKTVLSVAVAAVTLIWRGSAWVATVEGKADMLSAQIAELDKRLTFQFNEIDKRTATLEPEVKDASRERTAISESQAQILRTLDTFLQDLVAMQRKAR